MEKYHHTIKLTFWTIALPCLGAVALYCFFKDINPLDSSLFIFTVFLCTPMMILKGSEFQDDAYNSFVDEFRQMTPLEFSEKEEEVMNLPPLRNSAIFKEAYRQVYYERHNKVLQR